MVLYLADDVRNAQADQLETVVGTSPLLQIWSGTIPTSNSTSPSGTKLVEMTLPSDWATAAASGVKSKNGTWSVAAIAAGTATFYRICTSGGVSKLQDEAGATGSGKPMILDNAVIANAQVVTVSSWTYTRANANV